MYHHHKYDNNNDVRYLVIKMVYSFECQENNIDISSTYSDWFIVMAVEIETWDQHISQLNRRFDGTPTYAGNYRLYPGHICCLAFSINLFFILWHSAHPFPKYEWLQTWPTKGHGHGSDGHIWGPVFNRYDRFSFLSHRTIKQITYFTLSIQGQCHGQS